MALLMADDGEEFSYLPEWQQNEVQQAYDIVESKGKYTSIATSYEMNEYDIMERFCYSLTDH